MSTTMGGIFAPGGSGTKLGHVAVILAGVFALIATFLSFFSIWLQWKNYRKPLLQRYVVRIIMMVPVYALSSWVSLISLTAAFFIDPLRDIYEAFTIYTFFQLLINFLGGERSLLIMTHGRKPKSHPWPVSIVLPPVDISDPHTFLNLKRGILQYAWLKPILGLATIILKSTDTYKEGYLGVTSGYLWTGILYNVSVTVSLYSLAMFWACMHQDLLPFRPMPKFLCIKLIIFASYWQGFMLSILVWLKWIPDVPEYTPDNLARAIQDALICFELPAFAIAHWYAFSWKDYADKTISSARMPVLYAFRDSFGVRDLIEDTKMTFGGNKYEYRAFDSVGSATMVHEESAGRMNRMMEGMRYERGGKGKYWLPKPAANTRSALLGAAGNMVGRTDSPARRAVESGRDNYGTTDPDVTPFEMDDADEKYYNDAKSMEFGDYNYPVILAYDPSDHHCTYREDPGMITTSTNQALLRDGAKGVSDKRGRSKSRGRDKSQSSERSKKGKAKATEENNDSDEEDNQKETTGLLSTVTNLLKRSDSSSSGSSHISKRSGIVDLVVEDYDAEEIERVRARKEGGPGWNESEVRRYKIQYGEDAGETVRDGLDPSHIPSSVSQQDLMEDAASSRENFVVAEEDDDAGSDDAEDKTNDKRNSGYEAVDEENPWKQ